MPRSFISHIMSFGLLTVAATWVSGPARAEISLDRKAELHGIAASCAAFYQAAFFELDLPIEGNEAKRETYVEVVDALS